MEVKNEISLDLWNIIKKHYNEGNYTDAIIDAMMQLTDVIREKSGLSIDGEKLAQQAFINKDAKIHITQSRSDSEKDIQRGYGEIIKGMYAAIRNPRHHEFQTDKKEDTDTIINFVNYIIKIIQDSTGVYDEDKLFSLITEKLFVRTVEYTDILIEDIPKGKRLNVAIRMILSRNKDNEINYSWVMSRLLETLENEEIEQVYTVVSSELETESNFEKISTIFRIMPPQFWPYTKKVVRMRIENYIFEDMKTATYDSSKGVCEKSGSLATWANDYLQYFESKTKWTNMLINKMTSDDIKEQHYVIEFFWNELFEWNKDDINNRMKNFISKKLREKDPFVISYIAENVFSFDEHPWNVIFKDEIKEVESELFAVYGL